MNLKRISTVLLAGALAISFVLSADARFQAEEPGQVPAIESSASGENAQLGSPTPDHDVARATGVGCPVARRAGNCTAGGKWGRIFDGDPKDPTTASPTPVKRVVNYFRSGRGRRLFRLDLGPVALVLCAATRHRHRDAIQTRPMAGATFGSRK